MDITPETRAEFDALDAMLASTMHDCLESHPHLVDISSNRVVEDMEALRVHFGEERLNFVGFSYGSRLGSLYADAYPDRAGQIVLDASVSPRADVLESINGKHAFAEERLAELIDECGTCDADFGDDLAGLLSELDAAPTGLMLGGAPRFEHELRLYIADAVAGDLSAFYDKVVPMVTGDYGALDAALADEVAEVGLAADLGIRTMIVNCLDDASISSADAIWAEQSSAEEGALTKGLHWTALACQHLFTEDDLDPFAVVNGDQSPTILVLGGTRDANTPYEWSVEMADTFENSVLVTSGHLGHIAMGTSDCVDDHVTSFLVDAVVPTSDVECPAT